MQSPVTSGGQPPPSSNAAYPAFEGAKVLVSCWNPPTAIRPIVTPAQRGVVRWRRARCSRNRAVAQTDSADRHRRANSFRGTCYREPNRSGAGARRASRRRYAAARFPRAKRSMRAWHAWRTSIRNSTPSPSTCRSRRASRRTRPIAPSPQASRWVRCMACQSRSRKTSIRKAARRPMASSASSTSSPSPTARSSPTGSAPARSSSAAPIRRRSVSGSIRSTTCAGARTVRGRRRIRPAARRAARRRPSPRASRRSRTATTSPARCAFPPTPADSRGSGPRSGVSRRSIRRRRRSARSRRN